MDREDLHRQLIADGVRADAFDVLGSEPHPAPGEMYVLRFVHSGDCGRPDYWVTYYSERGNEVGLKRFASEDEACRDFLLEITKDATASR